MLEIGILAIAVMLGGVPAMLGYWLAGNLGRAQVGGRVALGLLFSQVVLLFLALSVLMEEYDMDAFVAGLDFWLAGLAGSLAALHMMEQHHGWRFP